MGDTKLQEQKQFEELIQGLIDNNYGCCNDFLLASTLAGLRENMDALKALGSMKIAGIGNGKMFQQDSLVRSDKINWIGDKSSNPHERIYLKKMRRFIKYLNKSCYTSIKTIESHYASYEQGNFYSRHLDQFKTEKGRKFSIILYLNEDWKEEDGGALALYPLDGILTDILPLEGRMVFFRSDEMEHEVKPSQTRERKSIAAWLKN